MQYAQVKRQQRKHNQVEENPEEEHRESYDTRFPSEKYGKTALVLAWLRRERRLSSAVALSYS